MKEDLTERKLALFRKLEKGWRYGEGRCSTLKANATARSLKSFTDNLGLTVTDVFPMIEGGLIFSVYQDKITHDFVIEPNGNFEYKKKIEKE